MLNYRKYNHNRRAYLLRRFSFSHLERFEPIGPLQLLNLFRLGSFYIEFFRLDTSYLKCLLLSNPHPNMVQFKMALLVKADESIVHLHHWLQ